MFQTHFCETEPLLKAVGLHDDAVSMRTFMIKVFEQMEEAISFCALEEGTNDLVGVLVASTFEKSQWFVKKQVWRRHRVQKLESMQRYVA